MIAVSKKSDQRKARKYVKGGSATRKPSSDNADMDANDLSGMGKLALSRNRPVGRAESLAPGKRGAPKGDRNIKVPKNVRVLRGKAKRGK